MNQFSFGILIQAYNGGILVDWWKSEGPPLLKALSLNGTFVYDAVLDSLTGFVGKIHHTTRNIHVHSSSSYFMSVPLYSCGYSCFCADISTVFHSTTADGCSCAVSS